MHFGTKNYLKSTRNHIAKHTLTRAQNPTTEKPRGKTAISKTIGQDITTKVKEESNKLLMT
jgi:hypothetical protein